MFHRRLPDSSDLYLLLGERERLASVSGMFHQSSGRAIRHESERVGRMKWKWVPKTFSKVSICFLSSSLGKLRASLRRLQWSLAVIASNLEASLSNAVQQVLLVIVVISHVGTLQQSRTSASPLAATDVQRQRTWTNPAPESSSLHVHSRPLWPTRSKFRLLSLRTHWHRYQCQVSILILGLSSQIIVLDISTDTKVEGTDPSSRYRTNLRVEDTDTSICI